jgi:hypothetical protein
MLTAGDEYPIHQTPEPVAFSGSDRNFYDRYFYNGYSSDGSVFFAAAMGVYPHLNIIDGSVSVLYNGKQSSVFFSRPLNMERMDTYIGGMSVEVLEPLKRIRLKLEETEGIALDVEFTGRAFPVEEPRFTRRQGPRMLMDLTRMTQNGHWSGKLRIDGKEIEVNPDSWSGTRDRSWGVRPVGAQDTQPLIPPLEPQFYWIWTPTNFANQALYFHVNDDGKGEAWNKRAVLAADGAKHGEHLHLDDAQMDVTYAPGTRRMAKARLSMKDSQGNPYAVDFEPMGTFLMRGIGYGHAKFKHGMSHGDQLVVEREDMDPNAPWNIPENLHIQEIVRAKLSGPGGQTSEGIGAFEQLFMGPHKPSGFKSMLDGAGE